MSKFDNSYGFCGVTRNGEYEIYEKQIYVPQGVTLHIGCVVCFRPKDVSKLPIICRFYMSDYEDYGAYVKAKKQYYSIFDKKGGVKNGKK